MLRLATKLTGLERLMLIASLIFVATGTYAVLFPRQMVDIIPANGAQGSNQSYIRVLTKTESRMYGALCVGLGILSGVLAFYPSKRQVR